MEISALTIPSAHPQQTALARAIYVRLRGIEGSILENPVLLLPVDSFAAPSLAISIHNGSEAEQGLEPSMSFCEAC